MTIYQMDRLMRHYHNNMSKELNFIIIKLMLIHLLPISFRARLGLMSTNNVRIFKLIIQLAEANQETEIKNVR